MISCLPDPSNSGNLDNASLPQLPSEDSKIEEKIRSRVEKGKLPIDVVVVLKSDAPANVIEELSALGLDIRPGSPLIPADSVFGTLQKDCQLEKILARDEVIKIKGTPPPEHFQP